MLTKAREKLKMMNLPRLKSRQVKKTKRLRRHRQVHLKKSTCSRKRKAKEIILKAETLTLAQKYLLKNDDQTYYKSSG